MNLRQLPFPLFSYGLAGLFALAVGGIALLQPVEQAGAQTGKPQHHAAQPLSQHQTGQHATLHHASAAAPAAPAVSVATGSQAGPASRDAIIHHFLDAHSGGTVAVGEQRGELREFTLQVHQIEGEIAPGVFVEQWAFSFPGEEPSVPGPEIRVTEGDLVRITLENTHNQPHTLHFHGVISVAMEMDGVPHTSLQVLPGESYTYEFVATNPGTHAYHCHVDTFTHHDFGMYGAIIIEPRDEEVVWDRDYTLILDEWDSRQSFGGRHEPDYNYFLINGKAFPLVDVYEIPEGEVGLLRLMNMGYEPHAMHLHGANFLVTHKDGYPLPAPYQADTLMVAPGERYHILIKGRDGDFPFHDHMLQFVLNDGVYPGGIHTMITGGAPKNAQGEVVHAHAHHHGHAEEAGVDAAELPFSDDPTIRISDFAFEQPVVRVKAGTTVTWVNDDVAPHTVTSGKPGDAPASRAFDSTNEAGGEMLMMNQGDTWTMTFTEPGEYDYYCYPHTFMTAKIIVE